MKKIRWVMLFSMLFVIFAIIGCGSQTSSKSTTQAVNQDTVQTQSNSGTPTINQNQTQSNASTQSANQDTAQAQSNSSTPTTNKDTSPTKSTTSTQSAKDNTQIQGTATPQSANQGTAQTPGNSQSTNKDTTQAQNNAPTPTVKSNPIVTITMASGDLIKLELYPDVAPNTVKSFISLVNKGFYNGLIFHRVIPGFMIQGGDPNGNGTGGPGYSIKGEFTSNGFVNNLKHERGVLSMGRTPDPNSAGSQFFIMVATVSSLDKNYAAFGKVISGMDAVDKIVNSPREKNDKPIQSQVMKSVAVDTFGVTFGEPEVLKR